MYDSQNVRRKEKFKNAAEEEILVEVDKIRMGVQDTTKRIDTSN